MAYLRLDICIQVYNVHFDRHYSILESFVTMGTGPMNMTDLNPQASLVTLACFQLPLTQRLEEVMLAVRIE